MATTVRDSTQLRALGEALPAARQQSEYSATLRDRVGSVVVEIVR